MTNDKSDARLVPHRSPISTMEIFCDPDGFAVAGGVDPTVAWGLSLLEDRAAHVAWLERHDPALRVRSGAPAHDAALAFARLAHLRAIGEYVVTRFSGSGFALTPESRQDDLADWTLLAPRSARWWLSIPCTLSNQIGATGLSLGLSGPWPA